MPSFQDLTTAQLKQALQMREQIESLQQKLNALLGGTSPTSSAPTKGKRTFSAATRKKMAAAQQARYAKLKEAPSKAVAPVNAAFKKKVMSPEAKAKIAAAMKARWAAKRQGAAKGN